MYVCGPTVYDFAHIGNARPVVVFDVLFRLLRQLYGEGHVTYVRNITDVDDKINAAANEQRRDDRAMLTERTAAGLSTRTWRRWARCRPTDEPRATEHIAEMIAHDRRADRAAAMPMRPRAMCCSRVRSMPDYGKLSRRTLDEMIAGARVEVAPYKRDPGRFRAVEAVDAGSAGLGQPLGPRPAGLAHRMLGDGGGLSRRDLRHPRRRHRPDLPAPRERDRPERVRPWRHAASRATGCTTASSTSNGEKMSKSLGNFLTIRDVLAEAPRRGRRAMPC